MMQVNFWSRVSSTGSVTECWLWHGGLDSSGYGLVKHNGRTMGAHRLAYLTLIGPVPDGLVIDHICGVRTCVNPWHMEPVTILENVRRGRSGQFQKNKTKCKHGHDYLPGNLYVTPLGKRMCRTCSREASRRYNT